MPYRRTPDVQARLDAQRELLLDAAVRLLAERGYAGCSVAAVAAAAGVATGSVYRHFPSKAELVAELFRRVVEREVAAVEQASASASEVTDRITAVIETFATRALKAPRLAYALLAEPVDAPVEQQRLVFRQAFRDIVARRISEGVAAGVLPAQDADIAAAALVGAVAEVMIGPLTAESADADAIPTLCTFAIQALGGSACDTPPDGNGGHHAAHP
ncbi:TetR/AcrR family transcriptional regulator [Haloechinothrix sp. LS1_15]|uniref:TetR/AcrR family transcriptional regulator n=1 Tax=Haloechinothrix sp. LS1_15 TaxID=2652248 RepID=UPI0029482E82|nr:TetR/AcrR family transcriptional regulator [Haloechinothrix sp. LS1_15]MDV6011524.1 TetR/AcrR family transcriptional regulator [Haloechinothrix sp. LS1_15]